MKKLENVGQLGRQYHNNNFLEDIPLVHIILLHYFHFLRLTSRTEHSGRPSCIRHEYACFKFLSGLPVPEQTKHLICGG